jgi:hypothetical protein
MPDNHSAKEVNMARRKRKSVSFDAMVKFFIRNYDIPTKKDIDILNERLDRIEKFIMAQPATRRIGGAAKKNSGGGTTKTRSVLSASDRVYNFIKRSGSGLNFADIKAKTGFEEKKLRNIIFRLHSMHRIKRVSRGVYTAS